MKASRSLFSCRVRYAPSPTGFIHLGGLRTALFNYLFARRHGGEFLLRIEDTDRTRLVPGSVEDILRVLQWAHISPRDKHVAQSDRLPLYAQHVEKLLDNGSAYRCFCSRERLEALRSSSSSYPRFCAHLSEEEVKARLRDQLPHTVRMRVPLDGHTIVDDVVRGRVVFDHRQLDDQVLMKSDGWPTYHLASVVDDHDMQITHVIRGEEWLPSTPKHVLLYKAFGFQPPQFAHLPLLLSDQGGKLSKRHADASVDSFVASGYLPEALVNFVAFLGWSPQEGVDEVMSLEQLSKHFSLDRVHKGGAAVSRKKLDWFNTQHMQRLLEAGQEMQLVDQFMPHIQHMCQDKQYALRVLKTIYSRLSVFSEIATKCSYFFVEPDWNAEHVKQYRDKVWTTESPKMVSRVHAALQQEQTLWESKRIAEVIAANAPSPKDKGKLMQMLRYKLTGTEVGASIPETMETLGRETVLRRLS